MEEIKDSKILWLGFLKAGLPYERFELLETSCLATLFAPDPETRRDLISHLTNRPLEGTDFYIAKGFTGDNQVFLTLKSRKTKNRFVAYVCDVPKELQNFISYPFTADSITV
ncbi:MAG TPA: hypothetical protein VJH20_05395 [Candidatus Nanoarchaeia archaeon]|nr:hypothetical protein [Candidatus Nanoarchaeia archaeon]